MLPHQVQDAAAAGTGLLQLGSGHAQGTSKVKQTGVQRRPVTSAEPPCLAAGTSTDTAINVMAKPV
jgi:hypothetical protein